MNIDAKYPDITVQATGEDGNAFSVIGRVAMPSTHLALMLFVVAIASGFVGFIGGIDWERKRRRV